MNHRATYSPEDNKLRLYPACRLSKEEYEKARAAGFIWAPRQELFVAPMWTPGREDFLLTMCEEIEDEDTTLVERAEERADRFTDYHEARTEDAQRAHAAVARIADNIPLGQPILVGHHSEKHARKDAERIENGMRKAVKMWETAQYWKDRAAGAIRHAKYKELPSVRARRIKGLEADKRREEKNKDFAVRMIKLWETLHDDEKTQIKHKDGTVGTFLDRARYLSNLDHPGIVRQEGSSYSFWSTWDVLRPDGERYAACPSLTPEEVQSKVIAHHRAVIARCDRWLNHINNRLEYERAMLAEAGGTVADRSKPERGGGCRCWASPRGGWSYIQKVNKVSVTVLDNWGNGGQNFTRTIPFDKLAGVMSSAEVQAARATGHLTESADKTGFFLVAPEPEDDMKGNIAPPPEPRQEPPAEIEAMREQLKTGVQVAIAPQLFPTPAEIAQYMVELADLEPTHLVLEPSAGTGAIINALPPCAELVAVEINNALCRRLNTMPAVSRTIEADFLDCDGVLGAFLFDRILMNPPFENGADIKHINHALTFLKPGGRLVAICANGPRQNEKLKPLADYWEDLPENTFEEQGTKVRTALLVINKQIENGKLF